MSRRVPPTALLIASVLLGACSPPPERELPETGTVRGALQLTEGSRGSAWLFLYPPGTGYPLTQAFPEEVTAVSDVGLRDRDARFLFANVPPNAYRLWGFLDTNRNFEPDIDVLGGPGAGDRVAAGVELSVERGSELETLLPITEHVRYEPPSFTVLTDEPSEPALVIEFSAAITGLERLELRADPLGILDPRRTGFVVSLPDATGAPDEPGGANTPPPQTPTAVDTQLYPQLYLRFLRKPGQVVPLDSEGNPAEVIIPLLFDPGPYLALLAEDREAEIVTDRLTAFLLPQAQAITHERARGRVVTALDAIPVGDYELWVVSESGQFWRMPNGLASEKSEHLGGPFPSQGTRFRVTR